MTAWQEDVYINLQVLVFLMSISCQWWNAGHNLWYLANQCNYIWHCCNISELNQMVKLIYPENVTISLFWLNKLKYTDSISNITKKLISDISCCDSYELFTSIENVFGLDSIQNALSEFMIEKLRNSLNLDDKLQLYLTPKELTKERISYLDQKTYINVYEFIKNRIHSLHLAKYLQQLDLMYQKNVKWPRYGN